MIKKGVCCIVLSLEPLKFRTMTYKRFCSFPRETAIRNLGEIITNNLYVSARAIEYCGKHNLNYRISSSIFPILTYDVAELALADFPEAEQGIQELRYARELFPEVRLSLHPDQFNVLASQNEQAVNRTIKELDFYADFMSRIGCPETLEAPINIHMNCSGDGATLSARFIENYSRLSAAARNRLVLENDDKTTGWSVQKLYDFMYTRFGFPITFDYLHHKCHPDNLTEEDAFLKSYQTWGSIKPLFHYSESIPDDTNPRKHSDYASMLPNTYGKEVDLDFEFKMKEKSFETL